MAKVPTALSKRIKELRESENLTQQDFAKEFKISKQTVSNYENNERTPDVTLMLDIAHHFNVSMDYLTGNSDYKKPDLKYMKDITKVELALIVRISKMPDIEKTYLCKLLAINGKAFDNFIAALIYYSHSDKESIATSVFKGHTFADIQTQALSEGIDFLKLFVTKAVDYLLADISKEDAITEKLVQKKPYA